MIIEYVVFDADSSVYGSNLLFNVDCSSGTFSLSNQPVQVEIVWVTVESRCNGTGIVNQQVSRCNVIHCRLVNSQLCHSTSNFQLVELPGCYRLFIVLKETRPLAQHCTALGDNIEVLNEFLSKIVNLARNAPKVLEMNS